MKVLYILLNYLRHLFFLIGIPCHCYQYQNHWNRQTRAFFLFYLSSFATFPHKLMKMSSSGNSLWRERQLLPRATCQRKRLPRCGGVFNPSIWKVEEGKSLWVRSQSGRQGKFQTSKGYTVNLFLKSLLPYKLTFYFGWYAWPTTSSLK